jgi:hypothetical protein
LEAQVSSEAQVKESNVRDNVVCRVTSGAEISVPRTYPLERVLRLLSNDMPAGEEDIIMLSVSGKKPWIALTTDEQFRRLIEDTDHSFLYFRIADSDEFKSDGEEYEVDLKIFQNNLKLVSLSVDASGQPTLDAIAEY